MKRKKNKNPKTTDGEGTATTVTENKDPTVTSKDPPKIHISSYCFQCGEDGHVSKKCKETGDLKCDNHGVGSHKTHPCNIYRKAKNLTVPPWLLCHEESANRVHTENEDEIFGSHPDDSLEVISESDQSVSHPNEAQRGGFLACTVTLASDVPSSDNEESPLDTDTSH